MMNQELQEKLSATDGARIAFVDAFNRTTEIQSEWNQLQLAEIAAGKSAEESWWAVFGTSRGAELHALNRIAEFDRMQAGFEYDATVLAAKAIIALKEE